MKPSYLQIVAQAKQHVQPNLEAKARVERVKEQTQNIAENKKQYGALISVPKYTERFLRQTKALMQKKSSNINFFKK